MQNFKYFILIIFLTSIYPIYYFGFRIPPNSLSAGNLDLIIKVKKLTGESYELSKDDLRVWNNLIFRKTKTGEYPGETPEYEVILLTENNKYRSMYNSGDKYVFFTFVPHINYGFFTKPPPSGWTQPLYVTEANKEVLKLIKYFL